jgi:hypothetical protein
MSTPLYLLAALGLGLAFAALSLLIERYVAPRASALHRQWLERRLRRRLVRGSDSYADELDSIERGLAPRKARVPLSPVGRVLLGVSLFAAGLVVLGGIVPDDVRPAWTRNTTDLLWVSMGLLWASGFSRTVDNPLRALRISGALIAVLALLLFSFDLYWRKQVLP